MEIYFNGAVMQESEFRAQFPNTSFPIPLTTQVISDLGGSIVLEGPQAQPTKYQIAYRDGVQQIDGQWFTKYSVADMEQEAKDAVDAQQAAQMRSERTRKLSECDWTQVADAPVDKAVWATYRQALRDITTQAGFPWDIQWPSEPQ
jgi:hypothetical protein